MVGDGGRGGRDAGGVGPVRPGQRHQAALADQPVEQLRVVDDLVVAAELGVLVGQGVEAVRAGHDDLAGLGLAQDLDVGLGQHLEQELVAGPPGRVAGAGLAVTQDGERDAGRVQQLGHGPGRALGPVVVRAGAADPEQVVDRAEVLDVRADDRDLERQVLGPVQPGPSGQAPGVLRLLQVLEQPGQLGGERRLDQHLVAAHVDDVVHVLDVDRALLHAGAAGGARPQHVRVDDPAGLDQLDAGRLRGLAWCSRRRGRRP